MSVARYIDKLKFFEQEFQKLGQEIQEQYSNSPAMLSFASDFGNVSQALVEVREQLESEVGQAELEVGMKKDLLVRIQAHDIFGQVSPEVQDELAEYLIKTKQPLWTKEEFIQYLIDDLKDKDVESILVQLPKVYITDIGRTVQRTPGDESKTLYTLGLEAVRKMLGDQAQRELILKEHVEKVVEKAPVKALQYVFDSFGKDDEL